MRDAPSDFGALPDWDTRRENHWARFSRKPKILAESATRMLIPAPMITVAVWSIPFVTPCDQNIVTPLVAGDVLIFSSLDTGTFAVRVQKQGNVWSTQKVWDIDEISMYMSSPIYIDGKVIGMSHRRQGQFFAIDAKSGSILWTSTGKIAENAALIADDKSIVILKDDGELQIVSPNARNFEAIRTYNVSKTSTWAHPVPISSGLLIKDNDSLTLWNYGPKVS